MYFDPDWIFAEKPDKQQYPNITGLMGDTPKEPKKRKATQALNSLADIFRMTPIPPSSIPTNNAAPTELAKLPTPSYMLPQRRKAALMKTLSPEEHEQVMATDRQMRDAEQQRRAGITQESIDLDQKTRQMTAWGELDPLIKDTESGNWVYLGDYRKDNPITGEPLRANSDLKSGKYDMDVLELLARKAMALGTDDTGKPKLDPLIPISIAIQESLAGKLDPNIGHTLNNQTANNPYDALINRLVENKTMWPQLLKDSRGITGVQPGMEDLYWLQSYNGFGKLFPSTESEYHGGDVNSFYGVPVTQDKPLDMAETLAYAKWIMSLRDNYAKDKDIQEMLQRIQQNITQNN